MNQMNVFYLVKLTLRINEHIFFDTAREPALLLPESSDLNEKSRKNVIECANQRLALLTLLYLIHVSTATSVPIVY